MQKRFLVPAMLFAIAGVGCTGPEPRIERESTAATSSRLIGGTADNGDPAVVVFRATGDGGGECTAEFITTTVLLTAAHCVMTEDARPLTGATFGIFRGNDISAASEGDWIDIDARNVHPHPAYDGEAHDIAVLVLSRPVDVKPLAFTRQPLSASDVGASVRLIGYGASVVGGGGGDDGFGVKRHLTTTIAGLQSGFVEVGRSGQTACGGDSGGPALAKIDGVETIIGVDSFSDAEPDCSGTELYQRVDVEAEFIGQFVGDATSPASADAKDGPGERVGGERGDDDDDDDKSRSGSSKSKKSSSSNGAAPAAPLTCATRPLSRRLPSAPALALAVVASLGLARRRRRTG